VYEPFHILIDDPTPSPALGFDDYAASLAEIATLSRPQFAVGVFGAWGSGKTTLMRAIEHDLCSRPEVVPVWFNAWRYEKEEHLIVPLLDTIREELLSWGARPNVSEEAKTLARRMASAVGKAARAILAGLTLKAGIPGAVDVSLEANKVATAWRQPEPDAEPAYEPKSFYHASFMALRRAADEFTHANGTTGTTDRRLVVFVDDLDRCLPDKALQVLESMKLFFDLTGFVFIVGLDQQVIERAVQVKYAVDEASSTTTTSTYISGTDYVKKIFQVQFATPRISDGQLPEFLQAVGAAAGLPDVQRDDLCTVVMPQITYLAGTSSVNPREVKRLVNAYTMQMKMLERKLKDQPNAPSAPAVLALQIMSFRSDWQPLYQALSNNPSDFIDATRDAMDRGENAIAVAEAVIELPQSLLSYLRAEGAPLLNLGPDLDVYVSTLESAQSTDPAVRELAQTLGRLRVAVKQPDAAKASAVKEVLSELSDRLGRPSFPEARDANLRLRRLLDAFPDDAQARLSQSQPGSAEYGGAVSSLEGWLKQVTDGLAPIGQTVTDLRRRTTTSSSAVP
jgi:hypothetical protein